MPAPLTDLQKRFALEYASNGGNATAAAKAAGYSERSAHEIGRQQLGKPHVLELVRRHLMQLRARSGAVGLNALVEICESPKTPASARVSAARALCEHAGLLGTAKEMGDARADACADADEEQRVDAREVLKSFSALRAANCGRPQ